MVNLSSEDIFRTLLHALSPPPPTTTQLSCQTWDYDFPLAFKGRCNQFSLNPLYYLSSIDCVLKLFFKLFQCMYSIQFYILNSFLLKPSCSLFMKKIIGIKLRFASLTTSLHSEAHKPKLCVLSNYIMICHTTILELLQTCVMNVLLKWTMNE